MNAQHIMSKNLTFADAGEFVPEQVQLVHAAELAEHVGQVLFVHRPRYLAHEHFYVIRFGLFRFDGTVGRRRARGSHDHFRIAEE